MTGGHPAIPVQASEFACVDLVNSAFTDHLGSGQVMDRLDSPEWMAWFLERYELTPDERGPAPIDELVVARRDIRRVLGKWARRVAPSRRDVRLLDAHLRGATFQLRVAPGASALEVRQEPLERSWRWVISAVVASAVELQRDGDPGRLKTCANPDCSWLFYDTTINHARQFCSTTPCGSLIRVRRFRDRIGDR